MWLGLMVGGRLALFYIHEMNRVNSCNDLSHDDSTICIILSIIIFIMMCLSCRPPYVIYIVLL